MGYNTSGDSANWHSFSDGYLAICMKFWMPIQLDPIIKNLRIYDQGILTMYAKILFKAIHYNGDNVDCLYLVK